MKILFLGLGSVGQRHLRNINNLTKGSNNYFTLTNRKEIFEIDHKLNLNKDIDILKEYELETFENINDAFKNNPELTIISSPSAFHYEQAKIALENNSHVFLEKPATLNSEECKSLIELSKTKNKKIAVSFQMRFMPWINEVKSIIDSKKYGNPVFVQSIVSEFMPLWHEYEDYRYTYAAKKVLGGGVTFTQIHEFDYLYYIFGEIDYISSISGKFSDLEIDVEDTSISLLMAKQNKHNFPINVSQDYLGNPKKRELNIQFSYANLKCNLLEGTIEINENNVGKTIKSFSYFERNDAFINQMKVFLDSLDKKNIDPPVNLKEAYKSIKIAELIKNNMNY